MNRALAVALAALMFCTATGYAVAPQDIYNVAIIKHISGEHARRVVANVPADKWLVLTDVIPTGAGGMRNDVRVFERDGEQDSIKLVTSDPYQSSIGLAFKPGSQVVLDDTGWATVCFTGYWAPAR